MAVVSNARTEWAGDLFSGSGTTTLASGVGSFAVNWNARSEGEDAITTPEELLAGAHASCFSMALALGLSINGTPATSITTDARVTFVAGEGITGIELAVVANVPTLDQDGFAAIAADAKDNCPVSKALSAVPITLVEAALVQS